MNLTPLATTQTSNTIPITDIQANDKKDSLTSTIKERLTSVKNFILTHKSAAAQVAGVAGLTLGGIVLGATSLGTVGISILVVGGVLLAAGTGGLMYKKIKEGKENGETTKQIVNNILKKTVQHAFIGAAVGCLASFCIGGTAVLPFLTTLKTKGEKAINVVNTAKETATKIIEKEKDLEAKIDILTGTTTDTINDNIQNKNPQEA